MSGWEHKGHGFLPWVCVLGGLLGACGPNVSKIDVDPELVLFDPAGATLAVTVRDERGNVLPNTAVRWHSSDTRVAEVDESGAQRRADGAMVYRVQVGDSGLAWLTAKAGSVIADVRVRVAIPKSVEVTPSSVTLHGPGESVKLQILVRDEHSVAVSGAPVWFRTMSAGAVGGASPPFSVESFDGGLQLKALAMGKGALMVYSGSTAPVDGGSDPKGSFWAPVAVQIAPLPVQAKVVPPAPAPAALSILPGSLTLKPGKTAALKLKLGLGPAKGKVAWKSLAPKIVAVNAKGKLKARKRGTAEVTATLGGQTAKVAVVVK